jgi:hypothetical protein
VCAGCIKSREHIPEPTRIYADAPTTEFGARAATRATREKRGTVIVIKKKNRNQKDTKFPKLAGIKQADRNKEPTGFVVVTYQGGREYTYSLHTFSSKFNVRHSDAKAVSGMRGIVNVDKNGILWLLREKGTSKVRLGSWKNRQKKGK